MRAAVAVLVALVIGVGCGEDCDCTGADPDSFVEIGLAADYGAATLTVCFGSCNEASLSGMQETVSTDGFADGWQHRRIAVEVIDAEGRVLTAFSAEPEVAESCCGEFWRAEEPAG